MAVFYEDKYVAGVGGSIGQNISAINGVIDNLSSCNILANNISSNNISSDSLSTLFFNADDGDINNLSVNKIVSKNEMPSSKQLSTMQIIVTDKENNNQQSYNIDVSSLVNSYQYQPQLLYPSNVILSSYETYTTTQSGQTASITLPIFTSNKHPRWLSCDVLISIWGAMCQRGSFDPDSRVALHYGSTSSGAKLMEGQTVSYIMPLSDKFNKSHNLNFTLWFYSGASGDKIKMGYTIVKANHVDYH